MKTALTILLVLIRGGKNDFYFPISVVNYPDGKEAVLCGKNG